MKAAEQNTETTPPHAPLTTHYTCTIPPDAIVNPLTTINSARRFASLRRAKLPGLSVYSLPVFSLSRNSAAPLRPKPEWRSISLRFSCALQTTHERPRTIAALGAFDLGQTEHRLATDPDPGLNQYTSEPSSVIVKMASLAAPSAARLREMVLEFTSVTGATERVATKFIKASNYTLNEAIDEYFHKRDNGLLPAPTNTASLVAQLNSMFESLRDARTDPKNCMELTSTLNYFKHELKINVENAEVMVVLELLKAPSIGEITRDGYVQGWTDSGVKPSNKDHAKHVLQLNKALAKDSALFKRVYRHAFVAGRERDQKALSLETAIIFWDMLFSQPGMPWKNAQRDWLPLWKTFLAEQWTRSVNRDMWNMTLQFALRSIEDDSLSFWSEDGAWPSVIDDFVKWCRSKGIGGSQQMEVDDVNA